MLLFLLLLAGYERFALVVAMVLWRLDCFRTWGVSVGRMGSFQHYYFGGSMNRYSQAALGTYALQPASTFGEDKRSPSEQLSLIHI